jgi:hypothetical protein
VIAKRSAILDLTSKLQRLLATRLAQDDPKRQVKHRLQLEIVDRLRRIHGVAEDMALQVLPRSVLVADLAS